ncbi:hypothetical protein TgHK011_002308, partial [Trichoderma gracile]
IGRGRGEKEKKKDEKEASLEPALPEEQEDRQPKAEEMDIDEAPTLPPPEPVHAPEPMDETATAACLKTKKLCPFRLRFGDLDNR